MARKHRHKEEEMMEDEEMGEEDVEEEEEEEDEEDDEEDGTIALEQAEEEEEEEEEDDEDDEAVDDSVEAVERRRLFQHEAEEFLENLTLDDVREVLRENDMAESQAPKLKKFLIDVINEGEMDNLDDAWDEALDRLEE